MFTKHLVTVAAAFALSTGVAYAQDPAPTPEQPKGEVNQRIENQKDRVQAGVADDQLTKGEAARAAKNDREIHAQEKADRQANGGKLTQGEKQQVNQEQNGASKNIYNKKHNANTQHPKK